MLLCKFLGGNVMKENTNFNIFFNKHFIIFINAMLIPGLRRIIGCRL